MRYGEAEAKALVKSMKDYKSNIDYSITGAIKEACNTAGWRDKKYSDFLGMLKEILSGVESSSKGIDEYQSHLDSRIRMLSD